MFQSQYSSVSCAACFQLMLTNTIYPPPHRLQLYARYRGSYAVMFDVIVGRKNGHGHVKILGGRLAGGDVNGRIVPVVK